MKNKILALAFASTLLIGLASCGGSQVQDKLTLQAIDVTPRKYSEMDSGFQFRIDVSSVLEKHKVTNISFICSDQTVKIEQTQGTGEDFLSYIWCATPTGSGEFTVSAKIDDLESTNSIKFTVLDPQYADMTFNVPSGYNITMTKGEKTYATSRIGDTYMIIDVTKNIPLNYIKVLSSSSVRGYKWDTKTNSWQNFGSLSYDAGMTAMYLELYPGFVTSREYTAKENGTINIDSKSYDVTKYSYSTNLGLEKEIYSYYSGSDFKMVLEFVNQSSSEVFLDLKVTKIETNITSHPFEEPK